MNQNLESMMSAIARFNLLQHPFYQAWSAGTLPVSALALYAREYGAFIGLLGDGWSRLNEPDAAAIEDHHAVLWRQFAEGLQVCVDAATVASVQALVKTASAAFRTEAGAIGALYAFEVQQPETADSKLTGLDTHYAAVSAAARPYFEAHACETGEDTLLEQKLFALPAAEQQAAVLACEHMAAAMWNALTGIHEAAGCTAC